MTKGGSRGVYPEHAGKCSTGMKIQKKLIYNVEHNVFSAIENMDFSNKSRLKTALPRILC